MITVLIYEVYMRNLSKNIIITATCLTMIMGSAHAKKYHTVVRSSNGNPVYSSVANDCIRIKQLTNKDECYGHCKSIFDAEMLKIYFEFDSSEIRASEANKLNILLKKIDDAKHDYHFSLVGYTDEIGKVGYNYRLSERRVNSVTKYILDRKTNNKIKIDAIKGAGISHLKINCNDLVSGPKIACLAPKRRVDIQIINQK